MLKEAFDLLLKQLVPAVQAQYGDRLVTIAVYGSVARGTMRYDSDVDVLIVAKELPKGRMKRRREFDVVEEALAPVFAELRGQGVTTTLAAVLKTPEEVEVGSPLFLDMIEDVKILYDREGFFAQRLNRLRFRLQELGARRIWRGNVWYWDLKPDYQPGEVFEL
ncbi:MAG: nucleotidyltransferase domain-containing protein [Nitrospirae bacterium]|nr:MAG: nucleotidyltransferase domain-containing protein [Nitrospirota bacterium]